VIGPENIAGAVDEIEMIAARDGPSLGSVRHGESQPRWHNGAAGMAGL
jgi:hypothetical protein